MRELTSINLHKVLSVIYFSIFKFIKPSSRFVGIKYLTKFCKNSDTLYVLAPGSSIRAYDDTDFNLISKKDSIGINFFMLHDYSPTFYLIEPHSNKKGYFKELSHKEKLSTKVIFKGYGSHKKIVQNIKNIVKVPRSVDNLFITKDSCIRGEWSKQKEKIRNLALDSNADDYIYNHIASIDYVTFLAYKMGYKNLVLCGFDMSDRYFYCDDPIKSLIANKYNLCSKESANKIQSDNSKKLSIMKVLSEMDDLFKNNRSGGIFIHRKSTKLSTYFPTFIE